MQVGRQGTIGHKQARETLAQMSEWMLNRGFLFPRNAAPAAKAYSAGQLRLTWLDAGESVMLSLFSNSFATLINELLLLQMTGLSSTNIEGCDEDSCCKRCIANSGNATVVK